MPKPDYDTTVARMAGNIAGTLAVDPILRGNTADIASVSVAIARAIVAEVKRTEPQIG